MKLFSMILPEHPSVRIRMGFLLVGVAVIFALSFMITGTLIPESSLYANIFQGGLLLVIFGSLLLEDKYTRPLDALVNASAAIISLITVAKQQTSFWWAALLFSVSIGIIAIINQLIVGHITPPPPFWRGIGNVTYQITSKLGTSNVIFSIVFLQAVFSVYPTDQQSASILMAFWGIYLVLWPLKVPHIIQALFTTRADSEHCGEIIRVDNPNLIRIKLSAGSEKNGKSLIACLGDGMQRYALPLFSEVQDDQVVETALLLDSLKVPFSGYKRGSVYSLSNPVDEIVGPIGLVRENSTIEQVNFETWVPEKLQTGQLVRTLVNSEQIYYQVADAVTEEESFVRHWHGFQIVKADQLGTLDSNDGFEKFGWLPEMNTPVYLAETVETKPQLSSSQIALGTVPGSKVSVVGDVETMISHHTAILGVTGSGKTELAYSIIRKAVDIGTKVLCIDITGEYVRRLPQCYWVEVVELSISQEQAEELGQKLHAVETGAYGAKDEKADLKQYADQLRQRIDATVTKFIESMDMVGIFTMPSISNTQATLFATELYLSSVFDYARSSKTGPQILIVLEEAHTVIPETSTMGVSGYDARAMVAKIAQIALQGRKYMVGLLVISQRTATVSKTVLTQCNTVISFASFDRTSEDFLSHFMGKYASKVSSLQWLEALAFGRGIKCQRPIVLTIPFNDALDKLAQNNNQWGDCNGPGYGMEEEDIPF